MQDSRLKVHVCLVCYERNTYTVKAGSTQAFPLWEEAACKWAEAFGHSSAIQPEATFVVPLPARRVGVVSVNSDYRFRFLILEGSLYQHIADPFYLVEKLPPQWNATGEMKPLDWTFGLLPPRTAKAAREYLEKGDSPLLLGTTQALVDGARVWLRREAPAADMVKGVWSLLPNQDRVKLWFTTFSIKPMPGLMLSVSKEADPDTTKLSEDMSRDYPEGRYELAMQRAVEAGEEAEFSRLIERRNQKKMLMMLASIVAFILAAMVILKVLD